MSQPHSEHNNPEHDGFPTPDPENNTAAADSADEPVRGSGAVDRLLRDPAAAVDLGDREARDALVELVGRVNNYEHGWRSEYANPTAEPEHNAREAAFLTRIQELSATHTERAELLERHRYENEAYEPEQVQDLEELAAKLRATRQAAAAAQVPPEAIQRAYEVGRDGTLPYENLSRIQRLTAENDHAAQRHAAAIAHLTLERDQAYLAVQAEHVQRSAAENQIEALRGELAAAHAAIDEYETTILRTWQRDTEGELSREVAAASYPLLDERDLGAREEYEHGLDAPDVLTDASPVTADPRSAVQQAASPPANQDPASESGHMIGGVIGAALAADPDSTGWSYRDGVLDTVTQQQSPEPDIGWVGS